MTTTQRIGLIGLLVAVGGVTTAISVPAKLASGDAKTKPQPTAVEDDMHEFMEYVFEPPYKRLKAGLAAAPADRSAWKGVKSDALILAEASNLLLHRHPAEHADQWDQNAVAVREQGSALYQAAKKRDFELTSKQFASLLKKCNHCHNQFADGEHQLAP